jgi:glyoxylase-like metal-dependent hydrolase (beta-lactamase superfamily II)
MIDTGFGSAFSASVGFAIAHMEACSVTPEQIDTVLLTHCHVDHVSGLIDRAGVAVFPDAELRLHAHERDFWFDEAKLAAASPTLREAFATARRALALYQVRTRPFTGGEVFPGVTAIAEPGHTPGHTGYLVQSGDQRVLVWGDIVHLPGIQFPRPEASMVFDIDQDEARATRQRMLEFVADEKILIAGMHLDFPTFGHVERAGSGYVFIPEVWSTLA